MAREISVHSEDVAAIEAKLKQSKGLPPEETRFLEFILQKAREGQSKVPQTLSQGPGWLFTWTYRF